MSPDAPSTPRRGPSLTVRLFLVYAGFVLLSGWFVVRQVLVEIKPAVRQTTEETLVDTANLLAEIVAKDLASGRLAQSDLARVLERYDSRRPAAQIWGINKIEVNHRIYVVDASGKVVLDSSGADVGADYSRWNDVYLTLRGRYGARSTPFILGNDASTVMYVAAPVFSESKIIGAVTVAKPNHTVQPFIERARYRLIALSAVLTLVGLSIGAAFSIWLSRAIRKLTRFAEAVTEGHKVPAPDLPGAELHQLAVSLQSMRDQLDGKAYVEKYVQTLTHELKSPLAAISGSVEVLRSEMSGQEREKFLSNIESETRRLQSMSERLLGLAQVEHRDKPGERVNVRLHELVQEMILAQWGRAQARGIRLENQVPSGLLAVGEQFLIRQALANLLENALDFTPEGGAVWLDAQDEARIVAVSVTNSGEPIPDYAIQRVTERFYSLARPSTGRKSSGLGLSFVREVAELHGGSFSIENSSKGVRAILRLPNS